VGREAHATLLFYSRPLQKDEKVEVYVNDAGPETISGAAPQEQARQAPVERGKEQAFLFESDWWRRGEHSVAIKADALRLGANTIRLLYSAGRADPSPPLTIKWVDLLLKYSKQK